MFSTGFKKQQSLILNNWQWQNWIEDMEIFYKNSNATSSVALPLDIILDYSDNMAFSSSLNSRTWENEEKTMMRSLSLGLINTTGAKLSTIIFPFEKRNCFKNESCGYNFSQKMAEFAKRMAVLHTVIGCTFHSESFEKVDPDAVVKACDEINGTLYVFGVTLSSEVLKSLNGYSSLSYYENTIRKTLENAKRIRKYILDERPLAKVHLEIKVEESRKTWIHTSFKFKSSFYCDEIENALNLNLEAITSWANLENFPIILQLRIDWEGGIYHVWFSMLRQLNNPYLEWTLQGQDEKIETEFKLEKSTVETHPSFLMQNYLKSNYKWKIDTCINWKEGEFVLNDEYFHSNYVGTIFRTDEIVINQSPSLEEYIIKLQFIFHRFQSAEIVVSTGFQKLVDGIFSAVNILKISPPNVFVCYVPSKGGHQTELRHFKSLLAAVEEPTWNDSKILSGIHVELAIAGMNTKGKFTYNITNGDSVLSLLSVTKESNVKAGILTSVKMCGSMIKNTIVSKGNLNEDLLREANYMICKDDLTPFLHSGSRVNWERILDGHLFIRRIANEIFPHLQVDFRVELHAELSQNSTSTKYMSLVDLLKKFGAAYDISYFIVEAFDSQLSEKGTGWWGIQNFTDLTNPNTYEEKILVSNNQTMWRPLPKPKEISLPTPAKNMSQVTIILFASFAVVFVLIALVVVFVVVLRYRRLHKIGSDDEFRDFLNGKVYTDLELNEMGQGETGNLDYIKFNPDHNLKLSDIVIYNTKILGQGTFGTVYKGMVKEDEAAIKQPNRNCSKQTFMNVLAEVKVLSYIGSHPNVVEFYGAYTKEVHNGILHIATVFCSNGCLESFLRKKNLVISDQEDNTDDVDETSVHMLDLNRFALEIAKGMEYVESKHIVHGDLASRNVLLNENFVCKIGDFGLSRKLYEYQKYVKTSQEPLPWKWMAYESLTKMEFTHKSDVWSYGVTLWEIYSLGKIPYAGLNWSVEFPDDLQNGLRPKIPQFSSQEIYEKMLECWTLNVAKRPSFTELFKFFQSLSDEVYSDLQPME